jgi:hypothetical protein
LAGECHRLPLDERNANLVREDAHDRRVLDPGNGFHLLAPIINRNEKDIAADVFTKDGQHL